MRACLVLLLGLAAGPPFSGPTFAPAAVAAVLAGDQEPLPPDALLPALRSNRTYLQRVEILRRHAHDYPPGSTLQQFHAQMLATELALLGNVVEAQAVLDAPGIYPLRERSADVGGSEIEPALDTILRAAASHRIVMLDEAPHAPQHRVFAATLLPGLYAAGFRYLAVETLDEADTLLNRRGYPVMSSGYYCAEPRLADFLRTALRIGFRLVAYDYEPPVEPVQISDDWRWAVSQREEGQARNLVTRIFSRDPEARVFICCGSEHLTETPVVTPGEDGSADSLCWLACRLRARTGLDPLTIDQTELIGHAQPVGEHPDYQALLSRLSLGPGVVTLGRGGPFFVPEDSRARWDVSVIHPRLPTEAGGSSWPPADIGERPATRFERLPPPPADGSLLLQAFVAAEDPPGAIPVDQVEYRNSTASPCLHLRPGLTYRMRVIDAEARVVTEWSLATPPEKARPGSQ